MSQLVGKPSKRHLSMSPGITRSAFIENNEPVPSCSQQDAPVVGTWQQQQTCRMETLFWGRIPMAKGRVKHWRHIDSWLTE